MSVLSVCASCVVQNGYDKSVSADKLYDYGVDALGEAVAAPCNMLADLLLLDAWVKATPEERNTMPQLRNFKVHNLDDTTFRIEDTCYDVFTYGKDFFDAECSWRIYRKWEEPAMGDTGYVYEGDSTWVMSDAVRLVFKGWDKQGKSILEICPPVHERTGRNGLVSRFTVLDGGVLTVTGAEEFPYYDRYYWRYEEMPVNGAFRVDIYRDGKTFDWVEVQCNGRARRISTSRD